MDHGFNAHTFRMEGGGTESPKYNYKGQEEIDNVTYSYFLDAKKALEKAPDEKKLERITAAINFTAATGYIMEPVMYGKNVTLTYLKETEPNLIPEGNINIKKQWHTMPQNSIVGIMYTLFNSDSLLNIKDVYRYSDSHMDKYFSYLSDRNKNKEALTKIFTGVVEYLKLFQINMNTHYASVKKPTIPLIEAPSPIIPDYKMDLLLDSLDFLYAYIAKGQRIDNRTNTYNLYNADKTDANKLIVTYLDEILASFNPLRDIVVAQQTAFKNTEVIQRTNAGCTCISDCAKHKTGMFSSDKFCMVLPQQRGKPHPELQCDKAGIKTPVKRIAGIRVSADISNMSRCGNPPASPAQAGGANEVDIHLFQVSFGI